MSDEDPPVQWDPPYSLEERRELNNELVVPAYRSFCEELELPFHFWDELPRSEYDVGIAVREDRLHMEAMNIFNRVNPELSFFKGDVVRYLLTGWEGEFDHKRTPVNEFLEQAADRECYLRHLEKRFRALSGVVAVSVSFVVLVAALWAILIFTPPPSGSRRPPVFSSTSV